MDIEVEGENYIPNSIEGNLAYVFKNTKVSFVILLIFVIFIYVGIFMLVGNGNASNNSASATGIGKNVTILVLELILWVFLIFIIYINIKNFDDRDIDFQGKLENLFNTKIAELSVNVQQDSSNSDVSGDDTECDSSEDDSGKEVFHIANNNFTYKQAKEMCEKYNARLATYDEIEKAYENGASWCSYGWSDDQMAFFPTQKKVYNELKKIPGHGNDCGRPGINGGYIANEKIKFGVNCYGKKPDPKDEDEVYMHSINHSPAVNQSIIDKANSKNNEFKKFIVAPFNKDKWTSI